MYEVPTVELEGPEGRVIINRDDLDRYVSRGKYKIIARTGGEPIAGFDDDSDAARANANSQMEDSLQNGGQDDVLQNEVQESSENIDVPAEEQAQQPQSQEIPQQENPAPETPAPTPAEEARTDAAPQSSENVQTQQH